MGKDEDWVKLKEDIETLKDVYTQLAENVRKIERVLSRERFIPTRYHSMTYAHKERRLIFDKRFAIQFEGNEAALLSGLFNKSGKKIGQAKSGEIMLIKIAKDNARLMLKPDKQKTVYMTLKRIYDRVLNETRLEICDLTYTTVRFKDFADPHLIIIP